MVDVGAQSPTVEDHLGKLRCPSYWTRRAQQDRGSHQKSILVAWYVEHRGRIRANLSILLVGETRPQEKVGLVATYPPARMQVAANCDRSGR